MKFLFFKMMILGFKISELIKKQRLRFQSLTQRYDEVEKVSPEKNSIYFPVTYLYH